MMTNRRSFLAIVAVLATMPTKLFASRGFKSRTLVKGKRKIEAQMYSGSDPEFPLLMQKHFPSLAARQELSPFWPVCAIIINPSTVPIRSFSVKMEIVEEGSPMRRRFLNQISRSSRRLRLSGRRVLVNPGGATLVGPSFRVQSRKEASTRALKRVSRAYMKKHLWVTTLLEQMRNQKAAVSMTLDAIVSKGGHILGPDESRLRNRLKLMRNADHDAGLWTFRLNAAEGVTLGAQTQLRARLRSRLADGPSDISKRIYFSQAIRQVKFLTKMNRKFGSERSIKRASHLKGAKRLRLRQQKAVIS